MTGNEFKRRLDRLGSEISRGLVYYSVWEALWPTDETVRIIDRLRNFVSPIRAALFETVLLRFSRVMAKDSEFPSLPAMLQAAIDDRDSCHKGALMSEQLGQQEENLFRVKDQHIAQLGGNPFDDATLERATENFVMSSCLQPSVHRPRIERYIWSPQPQRSAISCWSSWKQR